MPFQPGHKLSPGRKKGSKNAKTLLLEEIWEAEALHVPKKIAALLEDKSIKPVEKLRACIELMDFLYPRRKAVDHTMGGPNGGPIEFSVLTEEQVKSMARAMLEDEKNESRNSV